MYVNRHKIFSYMCNTNVDMNMNMNYLPLLHCLAPETNRWAARKGIDKSCNQIQIYINELSERQIDDNTQFVVP